MPDNIDVIIIGGGSAGFMAAVRAAQLGGKVLLVEKEKIGGICPTWGCIPTLFMSRCVEALEVMKESHKYGLNTGDIKIDYTRLIKERQQVIESVVNSMEKGLQANGVEVVIGSAKVISPEQVEIDIKNGTKRTIWVKKIIVATGSVARRYEIEGAYGIGVLTARELLDLKKIPKSLVIIGRSTTALELATIWVKLGSEVTILARKPEFLPEEDEELTKYMVQTLRDSGVCIYSDVAIERIEDNARSKLVIIYSDGIRQKLETQFVVFALGQIPVTGGLGLENAGIIIEDRIKTNKRMETNVKGIYAAGDVTGEIMAANVALVQGAVAGENAMGRNSTIDYRVVPRAVRTLPPMAAVGMTESTAKAKGLDIKIGRFTFEENPKAGILREHGGFLKIIAASASGEILGVHILGPEATELIHEAAAIMQKGGSAQDLAATIHIHPSMSEAIWRGARIIVSTMPFGASISPFIGMNQRKIN